MSKNSSKIPLQSPPESRRLTVQADPEQLYRELAAYMNAKNEKNVRRVFRELLGSGFSREEILGKVLLLLEPPPPQTLNGSAKPWSAKPDTTVGSASGDRKQHPTACSDLSTKLAHSSDHKPSHIAAEEPPFRPNFGQQSSQRGARGNSLKAVRASESSPDSGVNPSNSARNSASNLGHGTTNTATPRSAEQGTAGSGSATELEPLPREAIGRIGIPSSPPDGACRLSKSEASAAARSQSRKYTLSPGRVSNGAAVTMSEDAGPAVSKATREIRAVPKTTEDTVLPESGAPPTVPGDKASSPQSSAKNGGDPHVSMAPLDSIEAEKTGVKPEHLATTHTTRTSDEIGEALEALATVFSNNFPRLETPESTPERLAWRLQPHSTKKSFGRRLIVEQARATVATTPDASSADKETVTPRIGDAPPSRSSSPKPRSRVLVSAVRPMIAASILAAVVGSSYILWGSFGDHLEQAVMASVRNSATWLQHIRNNDWLASPKVAATVEKIVASQQTQAAYVTNVPQNARNDEYTAPTLAHPTPEGSAPKPGEDSIESERDSQGLGNLGAPSTSPATELFPSPTRRGEPDTKSQLPRSNALDQFVNLNEIPPRKPIPPDAQTTVSSKTITQPATQEQRNPGDGAPPIPGAPQARSIDVGALVSRGDQLLGMRDVTSARLFYERAAQAGDGHGALRMGMTFDPGFLDRSGIRGVQGDPARAISWYNRAAALGNDAGEKLMNVLTARIK